MRRGAVALAGASAILLAFTAPALGASKNVKLVNNLPEASNATAINFLDYERQRGGGRDDDDDGDDRGLRRRDGRRSLDVMLVTGRFGLKSYSLANPRNPVLLDEINAEQLRLQGDPAVNFTPDANGRVSTFWQNEDMDVDRERKLAFLSRDPRAYAGGTEFGPGETDPQRPDATNIAGVYIVDAKNPSDLKLLAFQQLPTGHTTTCVNGCKALWTGGPAATATQRNTLGWTGGRPIIVTDLTNPSQPQAFPMQPVDLLRRNGTTTAYSHDVQVDDMGIAWVSGDGGTRGYWTEGRHFDPLEGREREATALNPVPYGGGGLEQIVVGDENGGFEHNAERPVGRNAPKGDPRYRNGELLLATEEDFGPATEACRNRGQFTIASLAGSFNAEAWRPTTPTTRFRLRTVGTWSPYQKQGSRPIGGPYDPLANFCSAHYFDVEGSQVAYAWYGEGTRFLDISDPVTPIQFAYWRPDDGVVWASYMHRGYVYTADRVRGVDILKLTGGANAARKARQAISSPAPSRRQRRFLANLAWQYKADSGTSGLCFLQSQ